MQTILIILFHNLLTVRYVLLIKLIFDTFKVIQT